MELYRLICNGIKNSKGTGRIEGSIMTRENFGGFRGLTPILLRMTLEISLRKLYDKAKSPLRNSFRLFNYVF